MFVLAVWQGFFRRLTGCDVGLCFAGLVAYVHWRGRARSQHSLERVPGTLTRVDERNFIAAAGLPRQLLGVALDVYYPYPNAVAWDVRARFPAWLGVV